MKSIDTQNYPSIFAETPSSLVSQKYQFIKTSDVLNSFYEFGWNPRQMTEVKARKPHTLGFQKHLIRLTNPGFSPVKNIGDEIPEIILTNSHDGKNSFSFRIGIYRMVCSNGLIIPTEEFSSVTIKHVGNVKSQVQEVIEKMSSNFPSVYSDVTKMKTRVMSPTEIRDFAKKAVVLRSEDLPDRLSSGIEKILEVKRSEDEGNDLWKVYNRAQENLMGGNFETRTKRGNRSGTSIRSIDRGIKMNEGLWSLAKAYL